ncbi:MAG: hypothetical protein DHS80DRAFT_30268 [Piptocephalis tieghemiana]|nr:MAG: hypothetical protein DHS80DRAFT_30268 [Piptocephalis tieghemiana]
MHITSILPSLTLVLLAGSSSAQTVLFNNPLMPFSALPQMCQQTLTSLLMTHQLSQCLPQDAFSGLVQAMGGPTTNGVDGDGWVNNKDPTAPMDQGWAVNPQLVAANQKYFVGNGNQGFVGAQMAQNQQMMGVNGNNPSAIFLGRQNFQMSLMAMCTAPKCPPQATAAAANAIRNACAGSPMFTLTSLPWALDNYELIREVSCLRSNDNNFCIIQSPTGLSPFMNPMQAGAQSPGFTLESLNDEPRERLCTACQKNIITLVNQYNDRYPNRLADNAVIQRGREWYANHCGRWFLDGRMDFYSLAVPSTSTAASMAFALGASALIAMLL